MRPPRALPARTNLPDDPECVARRAKKEATKERKKVVIPIPGIEPCQAISTWMTKFMERRIMYRGCPVKAGDVNPYTISDEW